MNKKLLAIPFLALIAGAAAAPYGVGMMVEREMRLQQTQLRELYRFPSWITIEFENYRRGWLTTTADSVLTVDFSQNPAFRQQMEVNPEAFSRMPESFRMVFHHVIQHGPLILSPSPAIAAARMEGWLEVPERLGEFSDRYLQGQSPLSYVAQVSLSGDSEATVSVPAYSGPTDFDGVAIDWQGFTGVGRGKWFEIGGTFEGEAPLLEIRAADKTFLIRNLAMDSDTRLSSAGSLVGTVRITVAETISNVTLPDGARKFAIEGIEISGGSTPNGELVDSYQQFKFDRLITGGFTIGPGEMRIDVSNLDERTLNGIADELENGNPFEPADAGMRMNERMASLVESLLKRSPVIEIGTARLMLDEGEVSGRLKVAFDGDAEIDVATPASLANHVTVNGELSVPARLSAQIAGDVVVNQMAAAAMSEGRVPPTLTPLQLEQAAAGMLAAMEGSGMLVRDGDRHTAVFRVENGRGTLNGNPIFDFGTVLGATAATPNNAPE